MRMNISIFVTCLAITVSLLQLVSSAEELTGSTNSGERPGASSADSGDVAKEIQNAFKFMLLAKEAETTTTRLLKSTSAETTQDQFTTDAGFFTIVETTQAGKEETTAPMAAFTSSAPALTSTITRELSASNSTTKSHVPSFKFTDLNKHSPSSVSSIIELANVKTTDGPSSITVETTTAAPQQPPHFTTEGDFFTVLVTTEEPFEEETTAEDTTTTTRTSRPTTTTKRAIQRNKSPSTTTRRSAPFTRRTASTKSTRSATTAKINAGESVYHFKNSGIQFIIKSSTAHPRSTTPSTKRTSTLSQSRKQHQSGNELPEQWEDYGTTQESNRSGIAGVVGAGGVVPNLGGPSKSKEYVPVPYFTNPGRFWAKNWYWILIILLLIILLFIIPGLCCQVYLTKRYRGRSLKHFFGKKSLPKFGFGKSRLTIGSPKLQSHDEESGNTDSFLSVSATTSEAKPATGQTPSSRASVASVRYPASSLPEADIHQQEGKSKTKSPKMPNSGSEGVTVIVIPDPMKAGQRRLSSSTVSGNMQLQPSFDFPEPKIETSHLVAMSEIAPSLRSQSDIGLDIGNETIIKSNNIAKLPPRPPPVPPYAPLFRPPKPAHMLPAAQRPEVTPASRQRQPPARPPKRTGELRLPCNAPTNRHRGVPNKPEPARNTRRKKIHQKRDAKSNKKRTKPTKKKTGSSTQSIMEAAKGLEDILETITKLTREYPIPKLPEDDRPESKSRNEAKKVEPRRNERRRFDGKSPRREEMRFPDEKMLRRKEKRTKNWASDQRKIDKNRGRKKKKAERKSLKRNPEVSRQRRKNKDEKTREKSGDKTAEDRVPEEHKKKIPTLIKEDVPSQDKTKQERRRMHLERDLKKLQRYHNKAAKKSGKKQPEE